MRTIKFRAWDTVNKRMRYENDVDGIKEWPSLLAVGFHGLPVCIDGDSFKDGEIVGWNRDHNLQLMQFTGLHDKNGREIYEGDICFFTPMLVETLPTFKGEIFWDAYKYSIRNCDYKNGSQYATPYVDLNTSIMDVEVIGNIYENPELLK